MEQEPSPKKIFGPSLYQLCVSTRNLNLKVKEKLSKLKPKDAVFIFSVGGGNLEKNISPNLVNALKYAKQVGAKITGVVGRDGGYTAEVADACVIIPTVNPENITPHSEAFQAVIWHLLVSHPKLKENQTMFTSLGLGEMGYGLAGAIGASFVNIKKNIICLNCDGGLMMNLQELQTIKHHNLPIKIVIFNNDGTMATVHVHVTGIYY
jgi:hypothetical protein